MNFNQFHSESKEQIMIQITGEMSEDGAKEVAKITAQGRRFFWKCVGIGLAAVLICYAISLIKWW